MNEPLLQRYAVIDANGNIINVTLWDGVSEWSPPDGCYVVQSDTMLIGGTYIDGIYTPPSPTAELDEEPQTA